MTFAIQTIQTISAQQTVPDWDVILGAYLLVGAVALFVGAFAGAANCDTNHVEIRGHQVTPFAAVALAIVGAPFWPIAAVVVAPVVAFWIVRTLAIGFRDVAVLAWAIRPRRAAKSNLPKAQVRS